MSRFLESIKLLDGAFVRIAYHQDRVNKTVASFFSQQSPIDLTNYLVGTDYPKTGLYKCRLTYDVEIRQLEYIPYHLRPITRLKLVETDMQPTFFKRENRAEIDRCMAQRGDCDDVLLVVNGYLTDTSYGNIALYDGEAWVTPRTPLLYGTQRAYLLDQNKLVEKDIPVDQLLKYKKMRIFNAMIEFGDLELSDLPTSCC